MSKLLPLADIRRDGGTQPRAAIDPAVVAEYAEAMREGAEFPPVVVFYDGTDYWLADGFHRVAAYDREQFFEIPVDMRQGTQRDAIKFSLGVNAAHGLRRTNEDKRRCVERALADEEWRGWSDGKIAELCAVSQPFVSSIRRSTQNGFESTERTGADGRTYRTENIGKTPTSWTNPIKPDVGPTDQRRPQHQPDIDSQDGADKSSDPDTEDPTPADKAIADIEGYIDVVLDEVETEMERHYVVNTVLKYLRDKSIALNRSA